MSRPFYNTSNPFDTKPDITPDMQDLHALAELVANRMKEEGDLKPGDVAERSGNLISRQTVWNVVNEKVKSVSDRTLKALAKGTNTADEVVLAVVRRKEQRYSSELDEIPILFHGWEDATPEIKASVMEAIKLIADGFHKRRLRRSFGKETKATVKHRMASPSAKVNKGKESRGRNKQERSGS